MRVRRRKDGINYIEPEPIGICERCNRPVYWEDYILLDSGEMYHEVCYCKEGHSYERDCDI